jgi:broad specificity phosphatase PhoE
MSSGQRAYLQLRTADAPLTPRGSAQADALGRRLRATALATAPGAPRLAALYCSAMARAVDTACRAAAPLRLAPRVWPALCEVGGLFDLELHEDGATILADVGVGGLSRAALAAAFPAAQLPAAGADPALAHWQDERGWYAAPRRETATEAAVRIGAVLDELARAAAALAEAPPGEDFDVRAAMRARPAVAAGAQPPPVAAAAAQSHAIGLVCHGDFIEIFMRLALQRGGGGRGGGGNDEASDFWAANTSVSTIDFFDMNDSIQ